MSYIPNNHEAALLPKTGVFRLKVPLKCQNGTFEAGTVVELEQYSSFYENIVLYKVTGAGENSLIKDDIGINANTDDLQQAWNNTFEPVTDLTSYEKQTSEFKKAGEKAKFISAILSVIVFGFGFTALLYALYAFTAGNLKDWQALGLTATPIPILCFLLYVYDKKEKKIKKDLTDYKLSFLKECA